MAYEQPKCAPPKLDMKEELLQVYKNLPQLLEQYAAKGEVKTMYVDYHHPYVKRIWFQHNNLRVFLHKIEPCEPPVAFFHPPPWQSAAIIIYGGYEMGIGHSITTEKPKSIDATLFLTENSYYEMSDPDAWHYVAPRFLPSYSLMVTGPLTGRKMPLEPKEVFRKLTKGEISDILRMFKAKVPRKNPIRPNLLTKLIAGK